MTRHERFKRMYEHREADRVPIIDSPWAGTIRRWKKEGMPENADWTEYFGVDRMVGIGVDITPRYEYQVLEDTDEYQIVRSNWGVTMKNFKKEDSTPQFIDYKVNTPEAWEEAKARMTPDPDRIPWDYLKNNYDKWRADGEWIHAGFWFGFDVAHSWMAGTETILIALLEDPDWVQDIFATYLRQCTDLFGMIWDAGYHFDEINWPDDMGYKGTTFFSPKMYRELLKPYHKAAVDWAHDHGIYARMHSCGDIMTLLPDIVDTGIDGLNPLEVKAGVDPVKIKREYGDRLLLHGGINAVLWSDKDAIVAEIEKNVPILKENGGYIFSSDHSIPNAVSLENFRIISDTVKRVGRY